MKNGGIPHTVNETVDLAVRLRMQAELIFQLCNEEKWRMARTQLWEVDALRGELSSALMDRLGFGNKTFQSTQE